MRFNGWQRLWVFACVLMAAFTVLVAVVDFPQRITIEDNFKNRMDDLTPERIAHYRKLLSVDKLAALYDTPDPSPSPSPSPSISESETISQEKLKASQQRVEDLAALPARQTRFLLGLMGLWLGASISLYAIGWFIAWIIKGFKVTDNGKDRSEDSIGGPTNPRAH